MENINPSIVPVTDNLPFYDTYMAEIFAPWIFCPENVNMPDVEGRAIWDQFRIDITAINDEYLRNRKLSQHLMPVQSFIDRLWAARGWYFRERENSCLR